MTSRAFVKPADVSAALYWLGVTNCVYLSECSRILLMASDAGLFVTENSL